MVKLATGAFFPVSGILASDPDKDLAIIKVDGKNLPSLTLENDSKIQVGDHVVAIGSPLGLEGSVSDGVISSIRELDGKKWLQTTAPVSHGNSGGPLLSMNNEVVGVITLGVNPEAGQNLNFAVPASEATALLLSGRQQLRPVESVNDGAVSSFTHGAIWTSMTSGNDFKLRQDGDFLYIELISLPSSAAAGFVRWELRKGPDGKWRGQIRSRLPCQYRHGGQVVTNWCSRDDVEIEIDSMSDRRIEGVSRPREKFDCRKCSPEGEVKPIPFVWIPK